MSAIVRAAARAAGRLIYRKPLMRLAEQFLRRYYAQDVERRWGRGRTPPEWFDHRADLYRWSTLRVPFWVERGVYSREGMFEGCRVLDLCCGDGFYAYHFYSGIASRIVAVDRDPGAIAHATEWHSLPTITYRQLDVVAGEWPPGPFDVITWDAAIEHFSLEQIRAVLRKCAASLDPTRGTVCGYTILARPDGKSHPDHQHEFASTEQLERLLGEQFPHVAVWQTRYPERRNVYFRAAFDAAAVRRFA